MIYVENITTDANTSETALQKTVMSVASGLVYRVEIQFPPGPYGLLKVKICDGGHQLWPSKNGEYFKGDSCTLSFDDLYIKDVHPLSFDIYTYNEDDTYDHEVIIRLGLVSAEVYMARFLPRIGYEDFVKMLKRLSDEQKAALEAENEAIIEKPLTWVPD